MVGDDLKHLLARVQSRFISGDTASLLKVFSLPLVAYSAVGVVSLRDEAEFARMVEDYRSALLAMSVVKSEFDILSFDQLHNNRQKVKVRVVYYDADGNAVTTSLVRYFLLLNPDGYVVEMLEYIEMPLPLADVEKIVH